MKQLFLMAICSSFAYVSFATSTNPQQKQQAPQAKQEKIDPVKMTLPFFNLVPTQTKPDSLIKKEDEALYLLPGMFNYKTYRYLNRSPKISPIS